MNKKLINEMADRFLRWKLPSDFAPDGGINFTPFHPNGTNRFEPVGTNLLTAEQARQMLSEIVLPDEDATVLMESTANMLRGMTLGPSIPEHAKNAMRSQIVALESAVEARIG